MVFALLKKLFEQAITASPRAPQRPAQPAPRTYYKMFSLRCVVNGPPERYRRPNVMKTMWFEGTTLRVRVVPDFKHADISVEGMYDVAAQDEVLDVVYAEQEIAVMNMKANLPVLILNNTTGGYHLIKATIDKVADPDKGGTEQLTKEIAEYAKRHLKVTFA